MKLKLTLVFLFSFTLLFSQGNKKMDYVEEAAKGNMNFFQIVKKKKEELKNYDLTELSKKKELKQFYRWANFWKDRVDESGNFPIANLGYYNAGILDNEGKIIASNSTSAKSILSEENWVNVGPQTLPEPNGYENPPQMGRLNCFLRIKHPSDRNLDVLFVGAPNGGIWKSTDGGTSWSPKLDNLAGIGVTDIKTTPDATFANYTTKPIYVSTGDWDGRQVSSIGVLKSTDGGETYASTGLSYTLNQSQFLGQLIVHDENTVIVGANSDLRKTTDGGDFWTTVFSPTYSPALYGRVATTGTKAMFTGFFEVIYTDDYLNGTWERVQFVNSQNRHAVTVGEDGKFYIQGQDGRVKQFDESAKTFSNYGTVVPGYNAQGGYNQTLIVKNGIHISGGVNGNSSTNNGTTWSKTLNGYWESSSPEGEYIHPDIHGMGSLDGTYEFWNVNDGGLDFVDYGNDPTNRNPTVTYKSEKVIVTQSYSVAINPSTDDGAYVTGNQDNDTFSKRNGTWYSVAMGDGVQSAINYNNPDIRYTGNQNGFFVETDTGFQGQLQGNGKRVTIPGVYFYYPLEIHKTNPSILYVGGDEVYKITSDFQLVLTNLNSGAGNSGEDSAIDDIATHGDVILATGTNGLKRSINGGTSWASITTPAGNINSIDFDANDSNIIYLTMSGYENGIKVYKSTNGGINFTNISGDLPNIVIKEILLKQNQTSEKLFLATELGVYYSINGGTNWTKLGNGLPNVDVRDIEIHYTNDKLVAATFGRGLWEINIKNSTLSNNNFDIKESDVFVYPNPTKGGILNIKLDASKVYNYLIYNVIGGVVKKGKLSSNKTINISELADNVYILKVFNNEENYSTKFIKGNR